MVSAFFIVWRESIEAMLVVGILHAWLRQHEDGARGRRWLWGGVAAGARLALLLAAVMLGVLSRLNGAALEYFGGCHDVRRGGADYADGAVDAPAWTRPEARTRVERSACRTGCQLGGGCSRLPRSPSGARAPRP